MGERPDTGSRGRPLGTSGDLRLRVLLHHVPLALASAGILAAFMTFPLFDAGGHPHADIFSGPLPQARARDYSGPADHRGGGPMDHGAGHAGPMSHGDGAASGHAPDPDQAGRRSFNRQLALGSGYVAVGLLALTLLIGPAHLLLGRRNPVSSHLRRDVGAWTAVASVVHVIPGIQVHGAGRISDWMGYFVGPDGTLWRNSFGLGNWTGLVAVVIAMGLLAISSDAALRKLKAGPWKRIQRLNYALLALVVAHAFFYGAFLRMTSPFTLLLLASVVLVLIGQAVGVWLWRRRNARV